MLFLKTYCAHFARILMERISTQDLKAILEKLEEPLRLKDLARQLNLIKDEDILALEKLLKDSQTDLDM